MVLKMVFVLKSKPKGNIMVHQKKKKKEKSGAGTVAQHLKIFYNQ